jgi:hypothetical protein
VSLSEFKTEPLPEFKNKNMYTPTFKNTNMQGVSLNTTRVDFNMSFKIQGVIESCADILTTSYWLHVELGKNI